MVDDDFRLLTGRDGCFCPLHLARFNREQGMAYDRETLAAALGKDAALAAKYDALLKQSLIELAGVIRRAVDETDPEMPCSFCACSRDMRHAPGDRPDTRRARRTADDPDQQRPLHERIAAHSAGVAHVHRPPDRGLPVRKPAAGRTGHLSAQPLFDQRGHDAPAADLLDPRGVPRRKILAEPERLLGAGKRPALPRHPRPERPFLSALAELRSNGPAQRPSCRKRRR